MFRALKFKVDHVKRLRPLQGQFVVRRLGLAMINLYSKFEVSDYLQQRYERQRKM